MIVKSFLYNYIYEYQFLPMKIKEAPEELQQMIEVYYKGLCVQGILDTLFGMCRSEWPIVAQRIDIWIIKN